MSDPLVGTRLDGRYDLVELIGRGGMGRVYKATQTDLGRPVALKIMADRPSEESNAVVRFRREAQALSRLSHPNVVTVHGFGHTDDGWVYLVMELVEGPTLKDVIDESEELDLVRVSAVVEQVAGALAEAHSQGIIHRDLKPSNIVLTGVPGRDEQVKLLDFGLARAFVEDPELAQVTADDVVVGTSGYLAPEQLRREELGPAADIWALAVLTYRTVTGTLPFRGSKAEIYHRTLDKHPAAPSTFRPALDRAVDRAILWGLNKRPEDRPPSVVDFARAFATAVGAPFTLEQSQISTIPAQPIVRIPTPDAALSEDADATVAAVPTSLPSIPRVSDPAAEPTLQGDSPTLPLLPQQAPGLGRRRPGNATLIAIAAACSALIAAAVAWLFVKG